MVGALVASSTAQAALVDSYDLTSLAFGAQAVVRARRVGERKIDDDHTETMLRVDQSYMGTLAPGARLAVSIDEYPTELRDEEHDRTTKASAEVIAFLTLRDEAGGGGDRGWEVESSGLRVLFGGRVYGFAQTSNPGGFGPWPQGHDPPRDTDDESDPHALTLPAFVPELKAAIARATHARKLLDEAPSATRTEALLDVLGPPDDSLDDANGRPRNLVANAVMATFVKDGDLHGYLAGYARATGLDDLQVPPPVFTPPQLLAVASDRTQPLGERRTAMMLLAPYTRSNQPRAITTRAALVALTDDPDPYIQRMAVAAEKNGATTSRGASERDVVDAGTNETWPDASKPMATTEPPPVTPSPRGCGCDVPASGGDALGVVTALTALGATVLRRARRRAS